MNILIFFLQKQLYLRLWAVNVFAAFGKNVWRRFLRNSTLLFLNLKSVLWIVAYSWFITEEFKLVPILSVQVCCHILINLPQRSIVLYSEGLLLRRSKLGHIIARKLLVIAINRCVESILLLVLKQLLLHNQRVVLNLSQILLFPWIQNLSYLKWLLLLFVQYLWKHCVRLLVSLSLHLRNQQTLLLKSASRSFFILVLNACSDDLGLYECLQVCFRLCACWKRRSRLPIHLLLFLLSGTLRHEVGKIELLGKGDLLADDDRGVNELLDVLLFLRH